MGPNDPNKIKSNFNLSFNNSFNTSYATNNNANNAAKNQVPNTRTKEDLKLKAEPLENSEKPTVTLYAQTMTNSKNLISHGPLTIDLTDLEEKFKVALPKNNSTEEIKTF